MLFKKKKEEIKVEENTFSYDDMEDDTNTEAVKVDFSSKETPQETKEDIKEEVKEDIEEEPKKLVDEKDLFDDEEEEEKVVVNTDTGEIQKVKTNATKDEEKRKKEEIDIIIGNIFMVIVVILVIWFVFFRNGAH